MDTENDPSGREQPPANPNQAVSLRLSPTGNPNRIRRGNPFNKLPFADLLDAAGKPVPGTGNWTLVSVSPPTIGVTVGNNPGYLNGQVHVPSVVANMTITIKITPLDYPNLAKNMILTVEMLP